MTRVLALTYTGAVKTRATAAAAPVQHCVWTVAQVQKERRWVPLVSPGRAAHGVGGGFGDGHELSLSKLAARPCHCGEGRSLVIHGQGDLHFNFQNFSGPCTEFTFPGFL